MMLYWYNLPVTQQFSYNYKDLPRTQYTACSLDLFLEVLDCRTGMYLEDLGFRPKPFKYLASESWHRSSQRIGLHAAIHILSLLPFLLPSLISAMFSRDSMPLQLLVEGVRMNGLSV